MADWQGWAEKFGCEIDQVQRSDYLASGVSQKVWIAIDDMMSALSKPDPDLAFVQKTLTVTFYIYRLLFLLPD